MRAGLPRAAQPFSETARSRAAQRKLAVMLNILGWLLLGGLIGWLGSVGLSPRRGRQSNVVVAMIGAVLGGLWFNSADLGLVLSSELNVSLSGLFIACLGAACLLTIVNVVQHGRDVAPAG